ncbi:MAG TPA: hypothetical protein VF588_04910 [Pyrinomonadaceae bacterium]|jgi:hypothetical protein
MSNLIFYNCSGADTFVALNGLENNPWKIKTSGAGDNYYPFSQTTTRDLSKDHGDPGKWGRNNRLQIGWADVDQPMKFKNIQDPAGALGSVDLLVWIFPDRVVFSQQASWLGEVPPDNPPQ